MFCPKYHMNVLSQISPAPAHKLSVDSVPVLSERDTKGSEWYTSKLLWMAWCLIHIGAGRVHESHTDLFGRYIYGHILVRSYVSVIAMVLSVIKVCLSAVRGHWGILLDLAHVSWCTGPLLQKSWQWRSHILCNNSILQQLALGHKHDSHTCKQIFLIDYKCKVQGWFRFGPPCTFRAGTAGFKF